MANETTYALISSLLPDAWEAALMYAEQTLVMPGIVQSYGDRTGMVPRKSSEYAAGTVATGLGETTDISTEQAFTRSLLSTLTPQESGTGYLITDRRIESDDVMDVMADLTEHINYSVFRQVEAHLLAAMGSITGGTVGAAGSILTWTHVYNGRAILRNAGVPGPYNVVLHEYSYLKLATVANIAGLSLPAPLKIRDDIQNTYYIGTVEDMNIYTTGVLSAGTAVSQGIFNRQALALDVRRALRIEAERDASKRATEVIPTMIYGYGTWRPTWGVKIISDASTPT